ncbi:MAG TPA: hypothetical protein VFR32_04415 [Gaiellaceae bacterium]|nr:hypothetical protein [Gaiellaceae bacterium]
MGDQPNALDQLYAAEPEQFIAERKRLERELRDAGRADEADELAARPKPTVPVFAANRLAREHSSDVTALISAAGRLTAAHEQGDADALRKEQAELARQVAGLVRAAQLSEPMEQRLAILLRTGASDPGSADLLLRGVLSEELEPAAFGALAGVSLPPRKERPKAARQEDRAREGKRREQVRELEKQLTEARAELKRAERRVAQLTDRLEKARGAV